MIKKRMGHNDSIQIIENNYKSPTQSIAEMQINTLFQLNKNIEKKIKVKASRPVLPLIT